MINNIKLNSEINQNSGKTKTTPQSFCSNSLTSSPQQDKFEKSDKNPEKKLSKLDAALMVATGISCTALLATRSKIGSIKNELAKIIEKSKVDGMTQLLNKSTLLETLHSSYKQVIESGEKYSVAMMDMDNFKSINEMFDHKTGDKFLIRIAKNIKEVCEKHNINGFRYGGEEFAVLIPNKPAQDSQKIIQEIADAIKNDTEIQGHLPAFKEKCNNKTIFLTDELNKFKEIFAGLRKETQTPDHETLKKGICDVFNNYVAEYKPANKKVYKEINNILTSASPEELEKLLNIKTPIGEDSTLGEELNKIYNQYKSQSNDVHKWLSNILNHKLFTISGGVVTLDKATPLHNPEQALEIADLALKAAKENGKNTIATATNEIISTVNA